MHIVQPTMPRQPTQGWLACIRFAAALAAAVVCTPVAAQAAGAGSAVCDTECAAMHAVLSTPVTASNHRQGKRPTTRVQGTRFNTVPTASPSPTQSPTVGVECKAVACAADCGTVPHCGWSSNEHRCKLGAYTSVVERDRNSCTAGAPYTPPFKCADAPCAAECAAAGDPRAVWDP